MWLQQLHDQIFVQVLYIDQCKIPCWFQFSEPQKHFERICVNGNKYKSRTSDKKNAVIPFLFFFLSMKSSHGLNVFERFLKNWWSWCRCLRLFCCIFGYYLDKFSNRIGQYFNSELLFNLLYASRSASFWYKMTYLCQKSF